MTTVALMPDEIEKLRQQGEPHGEHGCSGVYRLIPIHQDAHFNVVGDPRAPGVVYLHDRLICDGCGQWGPRIEISVGVFTERDDVSVRDEA